MKRFQHVFSIILIVVVAILLVWVSGRYKLDADWTAGNRNSLTPASRQLLDAMPGKIAFTAYAYPGPGRADIRTQIDRYQRYRRGISLKFVDPAKHPKLIRKLGIRKSGVVRVGYQGRTQKLNKQLSEQTITNALQRLSVARTQWVVFLSGHGERDPEDTTANGYSKLRKELDAQGLKVHGLNLARTPQIPDNTALLVVASPRETLLPGEVSILKQYVKTGGNILWLDDPGKRYGLKPLAKTLDINWEKGTVIYPDYRELGTGNPAIALVFDYGRNPITKNLKSLTVFPFAGGLASTVKHPGPQQWRASPVIQSPKRSWLEAGSLDAKKITFNKDDGDKPGPVTMGMSLTREAPAQPDKNNDKKADKSKDKKVKKDKKKPTPPRQQRAVVIADSDFLANSQINSLGNMQLGVSIFQWLANRDKQISVHVPPAPDASLDLAPWQGRTIWYVFVIALPLLLLAAGLGRWWLRRRR